MAGRGADGRAVLLRVVDRSTHGSIERVGDISRAFPRQRVGDPAQLDSTLLYLLSPSSDFVTGTCIRVDDAQGGR